MRDYSPEWLCREVLEKATDAIIVADRDGLVRFWNAGAERIFDYSRDEALGGSLWLPSSRSACVSAIGGLPQGQCDRRHPRYGNEVLEVPTLRRDGRRLSIGSTILLVHDEAGELVGTAAFIRDVTARWEKERELKKSLAELEGRLSRPAAPPEATWGRHCPAGIPRG